MRRLWWRLRSALSKKSREQDLSAELDSHFALHVDDNVRAGMSPDEARRQARLKFGSLDAAKDRYRETGGFPFLESTFKDLRYGLRGLRRSPGFAASAVLSMGVGIGAALAVFTIADHLLLRPMPYREPDRLVMLWEASRGANLHHNVVSPANYLDWRGQSELFETMSVFRQGRAVLRDGPRSEERIEQQASPELLASLGVSPVRGRLFEPAELGMDAQSERPILISYGLWQSWFGGADSAIGRKVVVNGAPRVVTGVMPAEFYFQDRRVDLWEPLTLDPHRDYRKVAGRFLLSVGRLKPGVPWKRAQVEMDVIAAKLERSYPGFNKNWTVEVEPLREAMVREVKTSVWILLGAVGLLLLVACANVANLLLARFLSRQREMALRASIGASRWRLARQLLMESLVLGLAGGGLGLLMARAAVGALLSIAPAELTRTAEVSVDFRVVGFALLLSAVTTILFGTMPAWLAARNGTAAEALKAGALTHTGGHRLRGWLVCGEVALSVVLLAGSGLLLRSFLRLQSVNPGLNSSGVLTFRLSLSPARYPDFERRRQFLTAILDQIKLLPDVVAASAVSSIPFNSDTAGLAGTGVRISGEPEPEPGKGKSAIIRSVMPGSFEVYGIPLKAGRDFLPSDNAANAPYRFIVNEEFARKHLPGQDPLRQSISARMDTDNPYGEIVGVVGNVREGALNKEPKPTVYYVHAHLGYASMYVSVRVRRNPADLAGVARDIVKRIDPAQPVAELRTMDDVLGATLARERFSSVLLAGFSGASLLLAAIGIFGVLNYLVSERSRELGVRLAVGAQPARIVGLVVWGGMRFVLAGIVVGAAGVWISAGALKSMLFGIGPYDGMTLVLVGGAILVASFVAAWFPAVRAMRLDPMQVLRSE